MPVDWTSIGGNYTAIVEGNGHTISHLAHNPTGTTNFALFDAANGTVRNLGAASLTLVPPAA